MDIVRKNKLGAKTLRDMDNIAAQIARLEANQDYIAMMEDIDLSDEEESEVE